MNAPDAGDGRRWHEEGFEGWSRGGFTVSLGSVFRRLSEHGTALRVRVDAEHCNAHGCAHGGFLATLADEALAQCIACRLARDARIVTVNLDVTYLRCVSMGSVVETRAECLHAGSRVMTVRGELCVGGEPHVIARGLFARIA